MCISFYVCVCLYVNLMCAQAKFAEFVFYFLFDFILRRVVAKKGNPSTRHKHRFTRSAQLKNQHMFSAEIRIFHMLMMMGTFFLENIVLWAYSKHSQRSTELVYMIYTCINDDICPITVRRKVEHAKC